MRARPGNFILFATLDDMIRFDFVELGLLDSNRQMLCVEKYSITSNKVGEKSIAHCKNRKFMTRWEHLLRSVQWVEGQKEDKLFKRLSFDYMVTGSGRDNNTLTLSMISPSENSILYKWPKDMVFVSPFILRYKLYIKNH